MVQPPAPLAPPPKRASYAEAVKEYEAALEALQRRQFATAADSFRRLIDRYPEERELHERAQLYLRVCERESEPPPAPPSTLDERIYAATLALNAGSPEEAIKHLEPAAAEAPADDHIHYMMAVARALGGQSPEAIGHLRRAIELNAENRVLARQEPDFAPLRDDEAFRQVVDSYSPAAGSRRRGRARPKA